jgi:cell division ATPase FtsA
MYMRASDLSVNSLLTEEIAIVREASIRRFSNGVFRRSARRKNVEKEEEKNIVLIGGEEKIAGMNEAKEEDETNIVLIGGEEKLAGMKEAKEEDETNIVLIGGEEKIVGMKEAKERPKPAEWVATDNDDASLGSLSFVDLVHEELQVGMQQPKEQPAPVDWEGANDDASMASALSLVDLIREEMLIREKKRQSQEEKEEEWGTESPPTGSCYLFVVVSLMDLFACNDGQKENNQ